MTELETGKTYETVDGETVIMDSSMENGKFIGTIYEGDEFTRHYYNSDGTSYYGTKGINVKDMK